MTSVNASKRIDSATDIDSVQTPQRRASRIRIALLSATLAVTAGYGATVVAAPDAGAHTSHAVASDASVPLTLLGETGGPWPWKAPS